jgi:hypothetical protein
MGKVCSSNDETKEKIENEQTNRSTNQTDPSKMGKPGYPPQQMSRPGYPPQQMNDYANNQKNWSQDMGYQMRANNVGYPNANYIDYRTAPYATNHTNSGYMQNNVASKPGDQQRSFQNVGNPNSGFQSRPGLKNHVHPSAMIAHNNPVHQQNTITVGNYDKGVQNAGYEMNAGMTNQPNPRANAQTGFYNRRNQNDRYQKVFPNQGAPNFVNAVTQPEPRYVTKTAIRTENYKENYKGVGQAGPHSYNSLNYQTEPAVRNGDYTGTGPQSINYKSTTTGVVIPPNSSSCNCDVVDPSGGVKVYDPLVDAWVYEVDENTEVKGFSSTVSLPTNLPQSVNRQTLGAADYPAGLKSKYGVINAPPSRN